MKDEGIEAFYLDYREPGSIEALVAAVLERTGGKLDALYNNGAHAQPGAVEDLPVEALPEQFERISSAGTILPAASCRSCGRKATAASSIARRSSA